MKLENINSFLKLLSKESGRIIKNYFRKEISIDTKPDLSPVTIADKKAEAVMREMIMKEFPSHGIIGEEFGAYNSNADYVWVLDPIDGTKSFISGALSFGTLIALLHKNKPIIGVINHPILDEYLVGDNLFCYLNDSTVKIRKCNSILDSVMLTTDYLNIEKYQNKKGFEKLLREVKLYRNWGDCYGYYLLATGFADIMIDPIMSIWDSMALIPIINGAGGVITDYQGSDAVLGSSVVASNKILHPLLIKTLNQ